MLQTEWPVSLVHDSDSLAAYTNASRLTITAIDEFLSKAGPICVGLGDQVPGKCRYRRGVRLTPPAPIDRECC